MADTINELPLRIKDPMTEVHYEEIVGGYNVYDGTRFLFQVGGDRSQGEALRLAKLIVQLLMNAGWNDDLSGLYDYDEVIDEQDNS